MGTDKRIFHHYFKMNYYYLLLGLFSTFCLVSSITIREAVVVGDGSDEDLPVEEGESLVMKCTSDTEWSSCNWVHEIEDQMDSQGQQMTLVCSALPSHNGDTCTNSGGSSDLESGYSNRIRIETTPTTCGVRIDRAEPRDHGEWKCIMRDNPLNNVGAQSTIDVYAANQSTIYITKPDLWQDPDEIIEYTIGNSNTEIEASCTAYGGNPKPEFHWYVGDGRDSDNEILENIRPRTTEGKDDRGNYVTQEINWGPTRAELCNYRDLENVCYDATLAFSLICKVKQISNNQEYYRSENDVQEAPVSVNANTGSLNSISLWSVLFLLCVSMYFDRNNKV